MGRRLRKGDLAVVAGLVETAMADALPLLHQIEAVIAASIIGAAPAELRRSALHAFMSEIGQELFTAGELSIITLGED